MSNRRLTLRTSMALITAWGVLLAWVRSQGSLGYALVVASHSTVAWGLCFFTAFAVAWSYGPIVRSRSARVTVSTLLAIAAMASLYLAWGHERAMYEYIRGLDHGLPYPDPAINALERWFDARYP